ncbi:hypothetical protein [Arthrobacter ramosus]|uniref:Uncharacterized protein n=1 Tax=Arthrobacter ramosus TaxID=1672 RepID=A0ABV5XVR4_ARTRM
MTNMRRADIGSHALYPRLKANAGEQAVVAAGDSVPYSHPDVLHDVVDVARSADPGQVGNDIPPYPVNCHHDLVNRDLHRVGRPVQRQINSGWWWLFLLG